VRPARTVVEASLDDLRADDVRFLQEAAAAGDLHVRVPSNELVEQLTGAAPRFPAAERLFLAESLRWVSSAEIVDAPIASALEAVAARADTLTLRAEDEDPALHSAVQASGLEIRLIGPEDRAGLPLIEPDAGLPEGTPTVVVTGCFDWVHSGHVRFFMDAAEHGALYVVIGSDRNVRLLKGARHPLQREEERRYMVGSMKPVYRCLISSGSGWMDAEPEIDLLKPTAYVVNEDGDKPEKREFCAAHGLRFVVLQRIPHAGLPARSSTDLRGF
jgi:cytidyltransferase-like protein